MRPSIVAAVLTGMVALGAAGQAPVRTSSCEMCHSAAAAQHRGSAHAAVGLTCISCHGGDPSDMTERAMAASKGFRGKPARRDQPAYCARCHAKRDLMRPYGLPSDQYAEYQESRHGKAVAAGSRDAAVCTDCHTAHRVLGPDDPLSSVAAKNLPQTCGRCHDDAARMARAGVPTGQYKAYVESVHGKLLLSGGSDAAPSCASCHGSHGAAPPDAAQVGHVCRRCHSTTWEQFEASPHAAAAAAGRMQPCVACHGAHGIQHPTEALLSTACQPCHRGDQAVAQLATKLQEQIRSAAAALAAAEEGAKAQQEVGAETTAIQAALEEAHTAALKIAVVQHSLEPRDVERLAVTVRGAHEEYEHIRQEQRERRQWRTVVLFYVWGFLGASIAMLALKRHRFERSRRLAGGAG